VALEPFRNCPKLLGVSNKIALVIDGLCLLSVPIDVRLGKRENKGSLIRRQGLEK
jgi:hypothetical protein